MSFESQPLLPEGVLTERSHEDKAIEHVRKKFKVNFTTLEQEIYRVGSNNAEKKRIIEIKWERREKDFNILEKVKQIIDQDLNDEEYRKEIPNIETILLDTWIFNQQNNSEIKVSQAHTGVTPFAHTMDVLRLLKTDGLEKNEIRAIRWAAVWHDIGKIFGAVPPEAYFHSQLSVNISEAFFRQQYPDWTEDFTEHVLDSIRYHHISEAYDRGWLTIDQLAKRLKNDQTALFIYILGAADVTSIKAYEKYVDVLNRLIISRKPNLYHKLLINNLYITFDPLTENINNSTLTITCGFLAPLLTDPYSQSNAAD
jgi:hypothetical protein